MTTELKDMPLDDLVSDIEICALNGGQFVHDRVMERVLELVDRLKNANLGAGNGKVSD